MGKLPGFTFYTGDWLKDPELRRCSKAAKGVWIDMLALMFECADRGVFSTGGRPWSDQEIAAAVGGDMAENLSCIAELLLKGVANRNESGAILCKRMVRDQEGRLRTQERVKKHRSNVACNVNVTPLYEQEQEQETAFDLGTSKSNTKAKDFNTDEAANYVLIELGIGGRNIRQIVHEQIHRQLEKLGISPKDTAETMVEAWHLYEQTVVEFRKGPEKFFADGTWRKSPEEWKNNGNKASNGFERIKNARDGAQAALAEKMGH